MVGFFTSLDPAHSDSRVDPSLPRRSLGQPHLTHVHCPPSSVPHNLAKEEQEWAAPD